MKNQGLMIVTGGSRGIGAAVAALGASQGYSVCVNYAQNTSLADQVVAEILERGGRAIAVQADITDRLQVERLFDVAVAEMGPLRVLVNNAGISGDRKNFVDYDAELIRKVIDTNMLGPVYCAQAAARHMAHASNCSIINVSSLAATTGGFLMIPYAMSKSALEIFTLALSRELAEHGIRVNAVAPGVIETDQISSLGRERLNEMVRNIPLGRLGQPTEVAEAILWLASEKAGYITGTILPITGGKY